MSGEIENNFCALCLYFGTKFKNEKLEEKCSKVGPKGLKNLLDKSQERNDGFYDFANQNKDLYIHGSCRSTYIHLISVSSEVNKNKRKNSFGSLVTTCKIKFGRSEIPEFDYKNNCIICNQKFYHSKANLISSVTKEDFATDLCNRIENLDVQTEDTIGLKNRLMYDDLVLNNARYHVKCNMSFHNDIRTLSINNAGRPLTEEVTKSMEVIFNYIENLEDSQFTSNDLRGLFTNGAKPPNVETITNRLIDRYEKDNLSILTKKGGNTIFCLKESIYESTQFAIEMKKATTDSHKAVLTVTRNIKKEIKGTIYDNEFYPASDAFLENLNKYIPKSLLLLLENLIMPSDKNRRTEAKHKKITACAHAIMSAARPEDFKSPLLLSVGLEIHRKFGNKALIDSLHNLSFCSSYTEALRYERCAAKSHSIKIKLGGNNKPFMQFGIDNCDFNTNTLTRNNWHISFKRGFRKKGTNKA